MRFRNASQGPSYNPGRRYLMFVLLLLAMFGYLLSGVFRLQLLSSEEYAENAETRRTKTITLRGSRGMITDADAVILARDDDVYNVTFYRDASQNSGREYAQFSDSIRRTIEIIESRGNELAVDFVIQRNENTGDWEFNFGSGVSESVLQTRESQWRSNHYLTATGYPTANDCMVRLKSRYKIVNSEEEREQNRQIAREAGRTYVEEVILDEEMMVSALKKSYVRTLRERFPEVPVCLVPRG